LNVKIGKRMFGKVKELVKRKLYSRLGVAYNSYGIPFPLFKHIQGCSNLTLIDVGAHDGLFTQAVDRYCGVTKAILVEPLPHKVAALQKVFNSQNYYIYQCVAASKVETIDFEINDFEPTSSILKIKRNIPELASISLGDSKVIKCQAKTLDELVKESQLDYIDLIKIDVQGTEHLVIEGGRETLKKTRMIWTEVSFKALYEGSSNFMDIYHLLNQLDFKLTELVPGFRSPSGELLQGDALFVKL